MERKHMGKAKKDVLIPVAVSVQEMDSDYINFISSIKEKIRNERLKVVLTANTSMILLYWNIGKEILEKQKQQGWGAKVIDRMSKDLKTDFPEMHGFSSRNLKYMKKLAECWDDYEIVQRVVAQIPWRLRKHYHQ